jgi:uncharacterized protein YjbJ (UPF0337 family)
MNWDEIKGEWKMVKGNIKAQWGKLTDDDLMQIDGKKEVLIGKIQQRYGETKDEALQRVDDFIKTLKVDLRK